MYISDVREKLKLPTWAELSESEFGDLKFPCFEKAKSDGKNPKLFAEEVAKTIGSEHGYIKKVEALNGYVNIYLDVSKAAPSFLGKGNGPIKNEFSGKKVRLEHTSVNPNKALHIGHMRNIFLGEFIRRALVKSGAEVLTTYFVEDTGAQVADILVGFKYLGKKTQPDEKFDLYCSKVYKEVNETYDRDPALKEKRAETLKRIEGQDPETLKFLDDVVKKVLAGQMQTLKSQDIRYDLLDLESYILGSGAINSAMTKLSASKLAYVSQTEENRGCLVISFDGKERILRRSDGTFLYVAKDIAYAFIKHGIIKEDVKYIKFGSNHDGSQIFISDKNGEPRNPGSFEESITLVGSEQNAEQEAVSKTIKTFDPNSTYRHYSYELVALSQATASSLSIETDSRFLRMSGRKGATVEMDDLLAAIKKRLVLEAEKNGHSLNEENALKLSSNIIRYSLLKVSPNKMVIFDMDDAMTLKGDTALYLNYSYARGKSILSKTSLKTAPSDTVLDENEVKFLRNLIFREEKIKNSVDSLRANLLCEYAHSLCDQFNSFYEGNKVIGSKREAERAWLVDSFVKTLEEILTVLGLFVLARV